MRSGSRERICYIRRVDGPYPTVPRLAVFPTGVAGGRLLHSRHPLGRAHFIRPQAQEDRVALRIPGAIRALERAWHLAQGPENGGAEREPPRAHDLAAVAERGRAGVVPPRIGIIRDDEVLRTLLYELHASEQRVHAIDAEIALHQRAVRERNAGDRIRAIDERGTPLA